MALASLFSAGVPPEEVTQALRALGVAFKLDVTEVEVSGVRAFRMAVNYSEEHTHRTFGDIRGLLEGADLPDRARRRAIAAFRRLAEAEGAVHGRPAEEVTFHEVGAVDSIVDLAGSCVALEILGADSVSCGPLPMGSGVVTAAHGPLPVPGPATLEVLKGSRVRWTEEPYETTTPTGAALMHALTGGLFTEAAPPMVVREVGYGAGHITLEKAPNVLRAVVGELEEDVPPDGVELLETNVDDASGEVLAAAVEKLFRDGALDAWLEPIVMKRGRGAYKVCALVSAGDREKLSRTLMRETGSLGVRHQSVGRTVAGRRTVEVELAYGTCRVKIGELDGEVFTASPEYADVENLARKTGLPLPQVYTDARGAFKDASRPSDRDTH